MSSVFPKPTICFWDEGEHPGVRGHVALTIDDAFCRRCSEGSGGSENTQCSEGRMGECTTVSSVSALLHEFGVTATFFVISSFCEGHDQIRELLNDGHELGNHFVRDEPCHKLDEHAFERQLMQADAVMHALHQPDTPRRWFRAPHGRLSKAMSSVLESRSMVNVMCDCYADDPHSADSDFIAEHILSTVRSGSVILIHMPEQEFRQWNLAALRAVLNGLREKGLRAVSLSRLDELASAKPDY